MISSVQTDTANLKSAKRSAIENVMRPDSISVHKQRFEKDWFLK